MSHLTLFIASLKHFPSSFTNFLYTLTAYAMKNASVEFLKNSKILAARNFTRPYYTLVGQINKSLVPGFIKQKSLEVSVHQDQHRILIRH